MVNLPSKGPGETKPIHPNRRGRRTGRPPCGLPLGPARQSCKTNPIWPGPREAGPLEGGSCKTNPIPAGQPEPQGPSVRNKANLPKPIVQNEPNLEGAARAGRLPCKTKPIRRGRPAMGAGRQVCPAGVTRPKRAKRSQFDPDGLEQARPVWAERAKRSQFLPDRQARSPGQVCETKPIPRLRIADWAQRWGGTPALRPAVPGLRRAKCTKQSQFQWPHRPRPVRELALERAGR
jgi:hypothetical protein